MRSICLKLRPFLTDLINTSHGRKYSYGGRPQRVAEANATNSQPRSSRASRASHVQRSFVFMAGSKEAPPQRGCYCTPIQPTALTVELNRSHINTCPLRIQRYLKLDPCYPSRSSTTGSIPARKRHRGRYLGADHSRLSHDSHCGRTPH